MLFGLRKIILRSSRNNINKQIHKDLDKLNRDIKNLPCKTWKNILDKEKSVYYAKKNKNKNKNQKLKKYNNNIPYIF
tara:strand:+ start:678 stop:908 length:231 start_codon:yes stop_codon:yes gene_type:complete